MKNACQPKPRFKPARILGVLPKKKARRLFLLPEVLLHHFTSLTHSFRRLCRPRVQRHKRFPVFIGRPRVRKARHHAEAHKKKSRDHLRVQHEFLRFTEEGHPYNIEWLFPPAYVRRKLLPMNLRGETMMLLPQKSNLGLQPLDLFLQFHDQADGF